MTPSSYEASVEHLLDDWIRLIAAEPEMIDDDKVKTVLAQPGFQLGLFGVAGRPATGECEVVAPVEIDAHGVGGDAVLARLLGMEAQAVGRGVFGPCRENEAQAPARRHGRAQREMLHGRPSRLGALPGVDQIENS